jgi:hypothetical protein
MARLTKEAKVFVVQRLACFEPAQDVIQAVKDTYGEDVTPQALQAYDPTKVNGKSLSAELRQIFEDTRKRYLAETQDIPIASRAHRLRVLDRLATKAEQRQNAVLVMQLMEQAAKECGGAFENRTKKSDDDETPTPPRVVVEVVDARRRDA